MTIRIRKATVADAPELKAIDTIAQLNTKRAAEIDKWVSRDKVLVAAADDRLVGYSVFNHEFFGQSQVAMLMIAESLRGQRIGQSLLKATEDFADGPKVFVTTNQSNDRMQRLLTKSGYRVCGYIDELDPGDPELVYFKRIAATPD